MTSRILETLPLLAKAGVSNLLVQSVLKAETIDSIPRIIEWARSTGIRISLSAYTSAKNGNDRHCVVPEQLPAVRSLVEYALGSRRGNGPVANSAYYLSRIAEYSEQGGIARCPGGLRFVTVDPAGNVYRCSESREGIPYQRWHPRAFERPDCKGCWVPCRGESQTPLSWDRIMQVVEVYGGRLGRQPEPARA